MLSSSDSIASMGVYNSEKIKHSSYLLIDINTLKFYMDLVKFVLKQPEVPWKIKI